VKTQILQEVKTSSTQHRINHLD